MSTLTESDGFGCLFPLAAIKHGGKMTWNRIILNMAWLALIAVAVVFAMRKALSTSQTRQSPSYRLSAAANKISARQGGKLVPLNKVVPDLECLFKGPAEKTKIAPPPPDLRQLIERIIWRFHVNSQSAMFEKNGAQLVIHDQAK